MSIIQNIMNSCSCKTEKEAREILDSAIANACEVYLLDEIVDGVSGYKALSDAVDEVLSDCGIERDYEMTVADLICHHELTHPELRERAEKLKREKDEDEEAERRWREECRKHEEAGDVVALLHMQWSNDKWLPDYAADGELLAWRPKSECFPIPGCTGFELAQWTTLEEAKAHGILRERLPVSVMDEDTDIA